MDKNLIRKEMRKKIDSLGAEEHYQHSTAIRHSLDSSPFWHPSATIIAFVPSPREPDLIPLLHSARSAGFRVALVRMPDNHSSTLEVRLWDGVASSLESHPKLPLLQPGTRLPLLDTHWWYTPCSYDADGNRVEKQTGIVLVPGLAFTKSGARLGHGQGWYDRFLAAHPGLIRVGVAFGFQIAQALPIDTWDQAMDYVVNEQGILFCRATP